MRRGWILAVALLALALPQLVHAETQTWFGFQVGELSCPALYSTDASSINFRRSVKYGFGVLGTAVEFRLSRLGLLRSPRFAASGRKLPHPAAQISD